MTETYDFQFSLSNLQNTKSLFIEELGEFKVRQPGAGERLEISKRLRRQNEIINELNDINVDDYSLTGKLTDAQEKELKKLSKYITALQNEIEQIKAYELTIYKTCFSHSDPSAVDILLNTLSDNERMELFNKMFNPIIIKKPEPITVEQAESIKTEVVDEVKS